jgi:hypothetical protein
MDNHKFITIELEKCGIGKNIWLKLPLFMFAPPSKTDAQ